MAGLAWFLALVLTSSALHKLLDRERIVLATARLTGLGAGVAGPVSLVAAALEAVAALTLLFPAIQTIGAGIAAALWLAYGVALAAAASRGDSLDCGCSFAAHSQHVDAFAIGRALVLASLAVLTFVAAQAGATPPGIEPLFAAIGLFTLYHAAGEIAALSSLRRKVAQ